MFRLARLRLGGMRIPSGWIKWGERRIEDAYATDSVRNTTDEFE